MPKDTGYVWVPEDRQKRAERHVATMDKFADIRGKRVLDVGCSRGEITRVIAGQYDCEVVGIDLAEEDNWAEVEEEYPSIKFYVGDISTPHPELAENSFDRIVSVSVWEHIFHPWSALQMCQRYLKPDGKKYLYSMLYRSAAASHMINMVEERWPHLLFSPEVIMEKANIPRLGPSFWTNKVVYQQYLFYFRKLGFYITHESFNRDFWHQKTYDEHEDVLKLYPEWDLETDFFRVVLEFDEERPKEEIPDPVYRLRPW